MRRKFHQKKVDQSRLTEESITIELVSDASPQLIPDNELSSSTNFFQEELNLIGQWEVAIFETSHPKTYQNITERKFMFFD